MSISTSVYKLHFFSDNNTLPITNMYRIPLNIEQHSNTQKFDNNVKKTYNLIRNIVWICSTCGHTHIGANPPNACPICGNKLVESNQ